MISLASEPEAFYEPFFGEHLVGRTNQFSKAGSTCKNTGDMGAAGDPDEGFIFLGFQMAPGVDIEKFRMQGPLKQRE